MHGHQSTQIDLQLKLCIPHHVVRLLSWVGWPFPFAKATFNHANLYFNKLIFVQKKVFQPSRHFCSPKYPDPSIFSYFDQKTPLLCRFIRPSIVGSDTPWANTTPPHPKPRCWEIGAWAHVPLAKAPNFPLLWPRVPWTSLSPAPTDQRNLEVSKRKKSHGGLTKKIEQMRV